MELHQALDSGVDALAGHESLRRDPRLAHRLALLGANRYREIDLLFDRGDTEGALAFAREVVEIIFPPETPRREHAVTVRVADETGRVIFRDEIRFLKGYAWAFLGPFPAKTESTSTLMAS